MKRLFCPILIILLAVLANWQKEDLQQIADCQESVAPSIVTPQDSHHYEAILTDASGLYNICNPRPQRIPTVNGSHLKRGIFQCYFVLKKLVKPLNSFHDGRKRLETAPYCLAVSCDYYILALRHIIR